MNLIPASPVLHRELLVAARSKQTYRLRVTMGVIALIGTTVVVTLLGQITTTTGGGKDLLTLTATAAYFYCLAMGFSLTLTAIREERDQGALSLLFLTSLRGNQIVFAKLFARCLRTFEGLLAIMPVFALSLLLGGVTMAEFARVCAALLNTLFVSACLGMYISSKRLQLTAAAFLGGALALGLGVVLPVVGGLIAGPYNQYALGSAIIGFSPLGAVFCAEPKMCAQGWYAFALGASCLTGMLFLTRAIQSVKSNWQDKPNQTKKLRRLKEFQNWDFNSASRDPEYRAELLDANPICWLNCRDRFRSTGYWLYLFISYGILVFGWILLGTRDTPLPFWWFAALMFDLGIKAKLNQAAGIQLVEERKLGSLEMILCTPMGLERILSGLWMALRRQFFRVLATATAFNFVIMVVLFAQHGQPRFSRMVEPETLFWVFVYYTMINISNWLALAWVGTWFGLRNKPDSPMASFGMFRILARPWLFIGLGVFTVGTLEFLGLQIWRHISGSTWILFGAAMIVISDALYVRQARERIPDAFQLAATGVVDEPLNSPSPQPPGEPPSLLMRLWRRKWLRWALPVALIVGYSAGNHWKLNREYKSRLAELRTQGVPTSLNEVADSTRERAAEAPASQLGAVYAKSTNPRVHQFRELRLAFDRLNSSEIKARSERKADVNLLRAFVETNSPVIQLFAETMKSETLDFDFDHFSAWPHYRGLHNLIESIHCATLLAIHDGDINEAVEWISLAHQHLGGLQEIDLPWGYHHRRMHCQNLRKALRVLLASDLATPGQLTQLQRTIEDLIRSTPTFFVRQIDLANAHRIEELNHSDPRARLLRLIQVLPSRIKQSDMTAFHVSRMFGGMTRALILRLEAALTARRIAANSATLPADDLATFLEVEKSAPLIKADLDHDSYLAFESYREILMLRICAATIAAERYRLDHRGEYPERVDAFYPLYLKSIPLNPINGKPLEIEVTDLGCIVSAAQENGSIYEGPGGKVASIDVQIVIERRQFRGAPD